MKRLTRMKKHSIIFFFVYSLSIPVFSQWTKLSSGTTNYLSSVYFVNKDTGYVVGGMGTILKTTDGGVSWNQQNSGTTLTLTQVVFMDDNNGILVGDSGIILKTTNAGQAWLRKNSGSILPLYSVSFSSLNSGVAVGAKGIILKSNDGGNIWTRLQTIPSYGDTLYDLNSIRFSSTNVGYAGGGRYMMSPSYTSIMLKTANGGNSWTKIFENSNTDPNNIFSIFPVNDNRLWGFGLQQSNDYNPKFILTNDGGNTWTIPGCSPAMPLCNGPNSLSDGIFFTNSNTGYIAAFGKVYFTIDGGVSWSEQYVDSLNALSIQFDGIFFVNDTIGYVVGQNGSIYKTTNGGGILGINDYSQKDNDIHIFPNPTSGVFNVQMRQFEGVQMKIYNVFGECIHRQTIKSVNQQIDLSEAKSGIYFLQLKTSEGTVVKKIVKE